MMMIHHNVIIPILYCFQRVWLYVEMMQEGALKETDDDEVEEIDFNGYEENHFFGWNGLKHCNFGTKYDTMVVYLTYLW